jgi:hypothetical protein
VNRKALGFVALLVFLVAAGSYLALPSSRYNLDGLRAFPGLIQVKVESGGNTKAQSHEEELRIVNSELGKESGGNTKTQSLEEESGMTGVQTSYAPKDWRAGYQAPYYSRANVQMHFLFPLYWAVDYRSARAIGGVGQASGQTRRSVPTEAGVRGLQVANAICAALAVGLFALLVGLLTRSPWTVLATGFGLAFSTAFSSMATNIAEVVPALPWLVLALILLAAGPLGTAPAKTPGTPPGFRSGNRESPEFSRNRGSPWRLVWAGVLLGISAAFYFASAVVGLALAVCLALRKPHEEELRIVNSELGKESGGSTKARRHEANPPQAALLLVGMMVVTVGAIYVVVLLLAGYHTLPQLGRALFSISEQGNYGGLKPSNLVSVWLGFAGSIFPVLPDNFGGLRRLLGQTPTAYRLPLQLVVLPLVILLVCAFAVALFRALRKRQEASNRPQTAVLLGLAVFIGALAVSLVWDPYHPKFWAYSNIGLWLMIAGYLAHECRTGPTRLTSRIFRHPALIALALFCAVSTNLARRVVDAGVNPKWQAAQAVAGIVNAGPGNVVLGGWEEEFDYLTLLVPESSQVSLPDVILEQRSDSTRFAQYVAGTFAAAQAQDGSVYFLNLFNQSPDELRAFYAGRLRFPAIVSWLDSLRPQAQEVWFDPGTGVALYRLTAK